MLYILSGLNFNNELLETPQTYILHNRDNGKELYAYFCNMRSHAIISVFFKKKLNKSTDSNLEINWLHRVLFSVLELSS